MYKPRKSSNLKPKIEQLELRRMLASDLAWDPSHQIQFVQDREIVQLSAHEHRLVIGTQPGSEVAVPLELTLVREIAPNVREYQSSEPLTTDYVATLNAIRNVAFTTTVFVNSDTASEAVLLNEIIIALEPSVSAQSFFAQHDEFSTFRPLDGTPDQFIATVKNGYGPDALDVGIRVADAAGVSWMSPNFYQAREKFYTPNDARYPNQWNLNNFGQSGGTIDADSDVAEAWDVNQGGSSNIVIGIIDDGIDSTHPDLNVWTNPGETNFDGIDNDGNGWVDDIRGWNFVTDTNQSEPVGSDKHGTAVAGVAAARGDNAIGIAGAAYKSRVMSIKIFDNGTIASDASIASAIYYAGGRTRDGLGTWKSADIVNSSWGGGDTSASINAALSWGTTKGRQGVGAAYFFATGNDASSTVTGPAAESANIPGVIAVGATNNLGGRSDYSNYGSALDLVAPSSDNRFGYLPIDTTDRTGAAGFAAGDYTGIGLTGFGQTSAASALATGIGALVLAQAGVQGISLSPNALRDLLRNSTDLIGGVMYDVSTGKNVEFGYGRVNAATAVVGVNRPEISVVSSTVDIVNRGTVGFAPIAVGLFSEVVLRIRNQGTLPLNISSVDVTGSFGLANLGSTSLKVGESTNLTLRFLPIAAGSFMGKAVINSNDVDEGAFELNLFGSVAQTSIAGTVYEDYNGNSVFESFERFLDVAADFAYLDANNNGTREATETAVPIANGGYAFENLAAGTYTVRTEVAGWTVTQPGKNGYILTLTGVTDSITGANFGYSKNDRMYSYVYEEINRDGVINAGEPALPSFAVSGTHAYAVTNTAAQAIPARGAITSTINVVDPGTVASVVVLVNITHPFDSDLTLTLTAPDGTTVLLAQGVGGSGDNFTTTRFSDAGTTSINAGTAPFTGIFRPQQALSLFKDANIFGAWKLTVNDVKDFDAGQLLNWSLEFQRRFFAISDQNGWALVDLPSGTNTVGIELQQDWLFSRPLTGNYSIVSSGAPVYDRPFGIFYDNVAPTDLLLSNSTVDENQVIGTPIGNLSSIDPNRSGNTFTYTLVTGARPNDNVQFRVVGNVLQTNAAFNFEVKNSYLVRLRTTDAGGKFFEKEFTISITNINDAPSALALAPQSVDENKAIGSLVGTFTTTDDDAGDTHTYSLVAGTGSADNASFAVSGTTVVTAASFNFEARSSYSIRVRTTDAGGKFFEAPFTITINDVPDVGASIAGSVFEDYNGDGVYDSFERLVQTTTAFAYIDNNDNGIWESTEKRASIINGVYLIDGLAQGSYVVRSEVQGYTSTFPVKNRHLVTEATDVSAVTGINFGRSKNDRMYSYVYEEINQDGVINPGEPALPGFTVSGINALIVSNTSATPIPVRGSINSTINITDTGTVASLAVLVNIDHTWDSDLTLTLTAPDGRTILLAQALGGSGDNYTNTRFADSGGTSINTATPPFTGTFRPQQALSSLNSMSLAGTWTLSIDDGKDFDSGVLKNWSLEFQRRYFSVSDANGWALIDLPTGTNAIGIELQPDWLFSRPASGSYTITSTNTPVYDRPFGIFYGNVAPTDVLLSNNIVNENLAVASDVGILTSVDPNRFGNTFTYTLVTGATANDNSMFQILGDVLQTNSVFNFELKNSLTIRVRSTDAGGKFFEKDLAIKVRNTNDAPSALNLAPQTINENRAVGTVVGTLTTIDEDAGDTHTYSLVTGTGSANNASFAIAGNTLVASASFDFETKSGYTVRVRTQDQLGAFFERAFTITVVNVNESATSIVLSNNSVAENKGANFLVGLFSNNDPDASDTFTYALVSGTGSTGNSSFVIAGNQLRTAVNFDFETQNLYSIRVRVTDKAGLSFETALLINITDVNESPATVSLSSNTIFENDLPNTLIGLLSTNDPDANDPILYQFAGGIGSEDNFLFRIQGNQLQSAVTFDFEARSSYSVRIRATDQAGLFVESSFIVIVLDVNEAPTDLMVSGNEIFENSSVPTFIGNFQVLDVDASDTHLLTLVSGLGSDDNSKFEIVGTKLQSKQILDFESQRLHSIRVRATDANGLQFEKQFKVSVLNVNEAPTAIGLSPSEINEGLAVGTSVGVFSTNDVDFGDKHKYELVSNVAYPDNQKFQLVGNDLRTAAVFNFDVKNSYSILVRTTDEGGLFIEKAFIITVKNVNDPPTDIGLANRSIAEDKPIGSLIGSFTTTDPDGSDTFTYQLVAGIGALNNSSFTIVGNQLLTNTLLNFEVKPNYSIRVQSRDTGGVTIEKVFVIDVTNVNEVPTGLSLSTATIPENSPLGTIVSSISTQDPDVGDTFTYSLVPGIGSQNNSQFSIVGGSLRSNALFDFESNTSYSVRIKSTDAGGLSTEGLFAITVTNVNEAPFNLSLSGTLLENTPLNVVVLSVTATDIDAGDSLTYSLVAGQGADDNSKFAMTVTGGIRPLVPIDFETQSSYSIRAKATDAGGLSVERAFTVLVVNQNDAPTSLSLSSNSLSENSGSGIPIGVFSTIDQDGAGVFLYSLVSGVGADDNASFTLVGNELRSLVNFDFETKNVYNVRVRTTDSGGLLTEATFSILIIDVNEAPTAIALSNASIAENLAANALVGSFSTVDVDAGDAFVYTLVPGAGSSDNSNFAMVNNQLQTLSSFDFETKRSYSIRVRSADKGGLSTETQFVISVTDANDLPTSLQLSANTLNENVPIGSLIGSLSATDPDASDSLTFRFVSGTNDNSKFSLSGNQLLSAEVFNFELKSSYRVDIQAIDKSLNGPILSFLISIVDVNETIVDINLSNSTLDENVAGGSLVGFLTAVDPDVGDIHQFSLTDGSGNTDNSKFSLQGNELRVLGSPNFETQPSFAIRVRGTDRGGLAFVKNFTVNVRNLPEAPTAILLSNSRIKENQGASALIGALSATDPDAGDTLTYSFVTGSGSTNNGLFDIVNGNLVAKNSLDFEATPNLLVRIRATDSTQLFTEQSFVILVDNVNEAPTNIVVPNKSIAENRPAGTVVSVLSTTDADVGETFTYSLVPTATTGDNIRFEIVGNELRTNRKLNFEAQSSHQLRIRSTDSAGLFVEVPLTVLVTDVTELPPTAAPDSASTPANSKIIIDVLANDRDLDGVIDPTTVTIVTAPTSGSVRILTDGRIEYTPPKDQRFTATFTYTVKDNDEVVSNTALVSVKVFAAYQNQLNALDVDADGSITPLDVLTLVNDINRNGLRDLPDAVPASAPYLDTNGNGKLDPLDVLEIVNYINRNKARGAEGEAVMNATQVDLAFTAMDIGSGYDSRKTRELAAATVLSVDDYYRNLDQTRSRRR